MTSASTKYAYFGHHKCASTWIQYLIHGLCKQVSLKHVVLPTRVSYKNDLVQYLMSYPADFACVTNAEWNQIEPILNDRKAFHVIRDPRDIVVSAYFSHLKSHIKDGWPELTEIRHDLEACSKTEGLIRTIDNLTALPIAGTRVNVFAAMHEWKYNHPDILELRYEDIIIDPYGHFLRILRFLDLVDEAPFGLRAQLAWLTRYVSRTLLGPRNPPLRAARIPSPIALQIVQDYSFERISGGRKKGKENTNAHFRKGVAGDWQNHFDPEISAYFYKRTGDLLSHIGYTDEVSAPVTKPRGTKP